MQLLRSVFLLTMVGSLTIASAQTATLRLDSAPTNHCSQAKQGGMWVLELPPSYTVDWHPVMAKVYLARTDVTATQQHTVVYTIKSGDTVDLGCSAGNPALYYSILRQE